MYEVAGFGNALLDIIVRNYTKDLLHKYNLNEDDQKEIPASDMNALYNDISNLPNQMNPGGCAQNTLRILQWLLDEPKKTIFFGAVGDDVQSNTLKELVNTAGVCTRYKVNEDQWTGKCIALVCGSNRSLVANLGAAELLTLADIVNEETSTILKSVKIIYLEGFFLTNRLNVAQYIRNFALTNYKLFAFNLCGEYLCNMLPDDVLSFANSAHLIFGNRNEFLSLGKVLHKNDLKDIGFELNNTNNLDKSEENSLLRFGKVVVISGGHENLLCFHGDGEILELEVPQIPHEKIHDTTGAGDAFVAGFFAGLLKNYSLNDCLKLGCWTSSCIIQEIGCTIPQYSAELANIKL